MTSSTSSKVRVPSPREPKKKTIIEDGEEVQVEITKSELEASRFSPWKPRAKKYGY